ncbi:MAG: hypothetical protein ACE5LV_03100 [Candidatus Aminicenantales bacterium]
MIRFIGASLLIRYYLTGNPGRFSTEEAAALSFRFAASLYAVVEL